MESLTIGLGDRRYRVVRPWGAMPLSSGKITDVAVNSSGRIYVLTRADYMADTLPDCVHEFSAEGTLIRSFGAGRIADAHKIAIDYEDRIWVVDRDAHEIVAFSIDGEPVTSLGNRHHPLEPFNHPSDIAFDCKRRRIWVSDGYAEGKIRCFLPDGSLETQWGDIGREAGQFLTAHAVWVTRQGRVLVADRENNRVQVFDGRGNLLSIWSDFHRPSDIWGDEEGRIFVADGIPTLSMLDEDGNRLGRCRPVQLGAHGLSGDQTGRIYLAEGSPSRITVLEPMP